MIPQEIKDKIATAATQYRDVDLAPYNIRYKEAGFKDFTKGAEWMYETLALPTISEQAERIKQLEEALELLITDYEHLISRTYPKKERAGYFTCRDRASAALHPKG